jgi:hypothetical protein
VVLVYVPNNAWKGFWGLPPPVKLGKSPHDLYCAGVTWNPTQKKTTTTKLHHFWSVLVWQK